MKVTLQKANATTLKLTPTSRVINELIRQQWPKLTEEEINSHRTDLQSFFEVVKRQYAISQEEIDIHLNFITHEALYAAA